MRRDAEGSRVLGRRGWKLGKSGFRCDIFISETMECLVHTTGVLSYNPSTK